VCWLLWFSCQYLPSDWLERSLWGHLNVLRRLPPQSPGGRDCLCVFFFCLVYVAMCFPLPLAIHNNISYSYGRCSLYVMKVPLNAKQTNQPSFPHPSLLGPYCLKLSWISLKIITRCSIQRYRYFSVDSCRVLSLVSLSAKQQSSVCIGEFAAQRNCTALCKKSLIR